MFCVHCGAGEQDEQAYCRRCGKWLGASAPEQRMTVMLIFSAVNTVLAASGAVALYSTFLGRADAPGAVFAAAAFCIVIAVQQTLSFCFNLSLLKRLKDGRRGSKDPDLLDASDRRALPDRTTTEFVSAHSVIEGTTELLEPVPRAQRQPIGTDK